MPLNNLIRKHFPLAVQNEMNEHLDAIIALGSEYMVQLNKEERIRYGSINETKKLTVNKVWDYHLSSPQNSAPEVDWDEYGAHRNDRSFISKFRQKMNGFSYDLHSTKMLHDYDNYQDSLTDYAYTKYRAERGIQGAISKYQDLKQFFTNSGRSTPDVEEEGEE